MFPGQQYKETNSLPFYTPRSIGLRSTEHRATLHGASGYAPRSIGLRSTEYRVTLHGASAYAPRSIGLHSTEHRLTLHGASGYTPQSVKLAPVEVRLDLCGGEVQRPLNQDDTSVDMSQVYLALSRTKKGGDSSSAVCCQGKRYASEVSGPKSPRRWLLLCRSLQSPLPRPNCLRPRR